MNSNAAITANRPAEMSGALWGGLAALIGVGVVGLAVSLASDPVRAWQAYLVNYLFFLGLGSGGVVFSCALNLASGRWGKPVKRVAEGLGAFLPASFVLFLIMIPGLRHLMPWAKTPYGPTWWNTLPLLIGRGVLVQVVLNVLGLSVLYTSLRTDIGRRNEQGGAFVGPLHRWLTRSWRGAAAETAIARRRLLILSPLYAVAFACLLTITAVDFIMSLKPHWISTLIGGYYFACSFYISLAALLLGVIWSRRRFGLGDAIRSDHLADIAKLTMAMGIFSGYTFYGQFMLIWYGNVPYETSFLVDRMIDTPWRWVGWAVIFACFILPIVAMLNRRIKERSEPMIAFGAVALAAMWWDRFFSVAPSISGTKAVVFGLPELSITAGFFGVLALVFVIFMHRTPAVIADDPVLDAAEGHS
jgi:hypothetical protein